MSHTLFTVALSTSVAMYTMSSPAQLRLWGTKEHGQRRHDEMGEGGYKRQTQAH